VLAVADCVKSKGRDGSRGRGGQTRPDVLQRGNEKRQTFKSPHTGHTSHDVPPTTAARSRTVRGRHGVAAPDRRRARPRCCRCCACVAVEQLVRWQRSAGWLRQRRSWLTVASGAADAVAGAEEVEADASGGLEIEIEIEIEVEADASGALAADLERSGTMAPILQAQGHIMLRVASTQRDHVDARLARPNLLVALHVEEGDRIARAVNCHERAIARELQAPLRRRLLIFLFLR